MKVNRPYLPYKVSLVTCIIHAIMIYNIREFIHNAYYTIPAFLSQEFSKTKSFDYQLSKFENNHDTLMVIMVFRK